MNADLSLKGFKNRVDYDRVADIYELRYQRAYGSDGIGDKLCGLIRANYLTLSRHYGEGDYFFIVRGKIF